MSHPGLQQEGGGPTERHVPLREVRQGVPQLQIPTHPFRKRTRPAPPLTTDTTRDLQSKRTVHAHASTRQLVGAINIVSAVGLQLGRVFTDFVI